MRIMLAMDYTTSGQVALDAILNRRWPEHTSVDVVTVVEPYHLWAASEIATDSSDRAEQMVSHAAGQLRAADLGASCHTLIGEARHGLLDHARATVPELIIAGSHGHSAMRRLMLGSVAASLLRYAECSVQIVRTASVPQRILIAVDGSDASLEACRHFASLPWQAGTEVRLLSAVEPRLPAARVLFQPSFIDQRFLEATREQAMQRSLKAIAAGVDVFAGCQNVNLSDTISVLLENPRDIILQEARDWGADLIVAGSHGRHGVDRFLIGSTSHDVALHAECSVAVIRTAVAVAATD